MVKRKTTAIILAVLAAAGFLAYFFWPKDSQEWKTYENSRYNFSVDYPARWGLGQPEENNAGRTFNDPQSGVECYAYGFVNALLNENGNPQTLDEFVDWLTESMGFEEIMERNSRTIDGLEAQTLVASSDGSIMRAIYTLNTETGMGLACYYDNEEIVKKQNDNFEKMIASIKIGNAPEGITSANECVNLLNGVIIPFKDVQTFVDTEYTEATLTSREYWDKNKLPVQVLELESKDYACYPMPLKFDDGDSKSEIMAQPAVTIVEWVCELEYDEWKYLASNDIARKTAAENSGLICKKEECFPGGAASGDASVWLCVK